MRSPRLVGIVSALALALGAPPFAGPSMGQVAIIPAREVADSNAAARATLARQLARTGILSLRAVGEPSENDYRLTAHTLEIAFQLDPTNLDLLRRQIDAWHSAGDRQREAAATALLVQLDPADRVAQLRLISSRISAIQTAEARLIAYDRLLGPDGARIDASVRSRLALDAALLAREIGDDDGFVRRLTLATQLDSTNKDAAVLAATLVLETSDDPLARAEVLLNVIMADPMDASSHANLTRELRSRGAFQSALRFQLNTDAIHTAENRLSDISLAFERILSFWGVAGPEEVVRIIDERERMLRSMRQQEIEMYTAAGRQPPPGNQPEKVTIEPELEILRVAANIAQGRNTRVQTSAALLTDNIAQAQQIIADYQRQGIDPAQLEQASDVLRTLLSDLLWIRLWSGVQVEDAAAMLGSMRQNQLLTDERVIARYNGLVALWRGEYARAESLLGPLADTDPRARIGLSMLEEARGNTRAAAAHLAHIAMNQPGTMLGLYARSRIETLLGEAIRPSPDAVRLDEYFRAVPVWLDRMTRDPRDFMTLEVLWPSDSAGVLDGMPVTVRIRNIGRIPLAVGPNAPINSRLLLSPEITIGGQRPPQRLAPEVIEFNRVLRIMPGESVEMVVNSDLGPVGLTADNASTQLVTLRWQVAQGFLIDRQGLFYRGPLALSGGTRLLTRKRLSIPEESAEGYQRALEGAQGDRVIETLFVGRDLLIRSTMSSDRAAANQFAAQIVAATAARMPRMNAIERAMSVMLIASIFPRDLTTPIDQLAMQDPSDLVRVTYLLYRTLDPNAPIYQTMSQRGSDSVRAYIETLRERLRGAAAAAAEQQRRQQQQQQQQQQRPQQQPQQPQGGLRFDSPR